MRSLDHFTAMTTGFIILAAGLFLNGFVTSVPGFIAATIIWSIGDLLPLGHAYTIVASIAPDTARGQYMAVYGISWGLAAVGAPLLGTQRFHTAGPSSHGHALPLYVWPWPWPNHDYELQYRRDQSTTHNEHAAEDLRSLMPLSVSADHRREALCAVIDAPDFAA